MNTISFRLIGAIFSLHLLFAYTIGQDLPPFQHSDWFMWTIFPLFLICIVLFYRLKPLVTHYKYDSLGTKVSITLQTIGFWMPLIVSTLLVIGIVWYGGQSLLPKAEISQKITFAGDARIGNIVAFILCFGLYLSLMIWLYTTIRDIWKR